MAVVRWTSDFTLTTPLGELDIAAAMLDIEQCAAGVGIRAGSDPVAGGDGAIFHGPRFKGGYQMHLVLRLIEDGEMLVDAALQEFYDELMAHLDAILDEDGRIEWTVAGVDEMDAPLPNRMLDRIRTLEVPGPSGGLPKRFAFSVETPLPYVMDAPETTTELSDGVPVTLDRGGSARGFLPVARVDGPATTFTLTNNTTGLLVEYDSTRPGGVALAGGDYAEIDFVKKTVTLNGDVTFLEEGVVWETADFWPLVRGAQQIQLDGADGRLLWQPAWA